MGNRQGGSYEFITLRDTNIKYVADVTGLKPARLKQMLALAKKKGKYSVKVPIGINVFTREET